MFATIIRQYMYQIDAIDLQSTANFNSFKIASTVSLHFQTSYQCWEWRFLCSVIYQIIQLFDLRAAQFLPQC